MEHWCYIGFYYWKYLACRCSVKGKPINFRYLLYEIASGPQRSNTCCITHVKVQRVCSCINEGWWCISCSSAEDAPPLTPLTEIFSLQLDRELGLTHFHIRGDVWILISQSDHTIKHSAAQEKMGWKFNAISEMITSDTSPDLQHLMQEICDMGSTLMFWKS